MRLRRRLWPLLSLPGWTVATACSPARLLDGLQSVLNAAARLICNRRKYDHVTPLHCDVLHGLLAHSVSRTRSVYSFFYHFTALLYNTCTISASGLVPPRPGYAGP